MNIDDLRISKLRLYLFNVIDEIINGNYQINADMLSNEIDNYSLDKMPTKSTIEKWVTGVEIHKDVFSFRSRKPYSQDTMNNLKNIGFYEMFESIINSNNKQGILPEIEGIESVECLNCGTLVSADGHTAIFDIQIQITYILKNNRQIVSL